MPIVHEAQPKAVVPPPTNTDKPVDKSAEEIEKANAAEEAESIKLGEALRKTLGIPEAKPKADKAKDDEKKKAEEAAAKKKEEDDKAALAAKEKDGKGKKVKVSVAPPPVNVAEVAASAASAAATATAKELLPKFTQQPAEKPAPDTSRLTRDEQYDLKVYQHLAEKDPKRFGGEPAKYLDGLKKVSEYEAQWKAKNPGEDFDPDDDKHSDFFASIEPAVTVHDFEQAEEAIKDAEIEKRVDARLEEKLKPVNEKAEKLQRERKIEELEPVAARAADLSLRAVFATLVPDGDKILEKDGPEKAAEALQKSDPLAFDIMVQTSQLSAPVIQEVVRLWRSDGLYRFNPQKPEHAFIQKFLHENERNIANLPPEKQLWQDEDGVTRRFATAAEYEKLTPDQRKARWVIDDRHLVHMLNNFYAGAAKAEYDRINRYRGGKPAEVKVEKTPEEIAKEKQAETKSPSVGDSIKVDTSVKTADLKDEPLAQKTRLILFGR